ncbi:MAG: hypothetical protein IPN03_14900 [Holophagales bacterium]|nr:hypothetical protein [Holophagales bacterium]
MSPEPAVTPNRVQTATSASRANRGPREKKPWKRRPPYVPSYRRYWTAYGKPARPREPNILSNLALRERVARYARIAGRTIRKKAAIPIGRKISFGSEPGVRCIRPSGSRMNPMKIVKTKTVTTALTRQPRTYDIATDWTIRPITASAGRRRAIGGGRSANKQFYAAPGCVSPFGSRYDARP